MFSLILLTKILTFDNIIKRNKSTPIFRNCSQQINMEEYRSGHNGPHSKCGYPQGYEGSNPSSSARKKHFFGSAFFNEVFRYCRMLSAKWHEVSDDMKCATMAHKE